MMNEDPKKDRITVLLRRLEGHAADLRATCASLDAEWRNPPVARPDTSDRRFSLEEVADSMEAVLLAWSCDPARSFEPGFNLWDRHALIDLMSRSLQDRRT